MARRRDFGLPIASSAPLSARTPMELGLEATASAFIPFITQQRPLLLLLLCSSLLWCTHAIKRHPFEQSMVRLSIRRSRYGAAVNRPSVLVVEHLQASRPPSPATVRAAYRMPGQIGGGDWSSVECRWSNQCSFHCRCTGVAGFSPENFDTEPHSANPPTQEWGWGGGRGEQTTEEELTL